MTETPSTEPTAVGANSTLLILSSMLTDTINGSADIINGSAVPPEPEYQALRLFNKILLPILMVVIMTSIGCLVTLDGLKDALRRPVGIIIGFGGQFIVLPLLAFCLAVALRMEAPHALGMMMVATSPGGVSSSLFVYWMNGNICLSLCMSTVATLAAVGMMPLNLFIYTRYWEQANIKIPYKDIALALALILIPVAVGFLIRYKKESWTPYIIKTGSILGLVAIIINMITNAIVNRGVFSAGWSVWFAAVCLPFSSFGLAYLLAWILRQNHKNCRTIAVETSSQNVALTLAIIGVTFKNMELDALSVYPSIFSIFLIIDGLVMVPLYWLSLRYLLPRIRRLRKKGNPGKAASDPNDEGLVLNITITRGMSVETASPVQTPLPEL
ncbi:ileal sodium/bile acid cotransporter-like [Diadema antillarum]|uniref:ileal sodium/bile acid cotransporter-like n=1 Tax=Diadema antillarum TaxID=105358 RepID=UPI003A88B4E7